MEEKDIQIIVFCYNRLDHTKKTLNALACNYGFKNFPVKIFSDGPQLDNVESVQKLRKFLESFAEKHPNVELVKRDKNLGLAKSIIMGIEDALESKEAVIIVEDDIRTSEFFLQYMSRMLNLFKDKKEIGCISGYNNPNSLFKKPKSYSYDIFFAPRTCSWGWATWKDRFVNVDWQIKDFEQFWNDKKKRRMFEIGGRDLSAALKRQVVEDVDTWDIQWAYHNFKNNRLTIYPCVSYVENIGHDGSGIHCLTSSKFLNKNLNSSINLSIPKEIVLDSNVMKEFQRMYKINIRTIPLYIELVFSKLKKIISKKS